MEAGVVTLAGALAQVISLNVQRRDMTAAQRAIVAARTMEAIGERRGKWDRGESKSEKSSHSYPAKSREIVAKQFKVSDKSVQQAKAILANEEDADLASQVEGRTTPCRRIPLLRMRQIVAFRPARERYRFQGAGCGLAEGVARGSVRGGRGGHRRVLPNCSG